MSSLVRRMQRQVMPSQKVHRRLRRNLKGDWVPYWAANPPRGKFWMGRGDKLGVNNPKGRERIARLKREAKRAAAKGQR